MSYNLMQFLKIRSLVFVFLYVLKSSFTAFCTLLFFHLFTYDG